MEGHSDDQPIRSGNYPSNWDLSIRRAVSVVRLFVESGGIPPERLSAVGYGDSRPVVPNDSHDHRARNRRVEIIMMIEEEA